MTLNARGFGVAFETARRINVNWRVFCLVTLWAIYFSGNLADDLPKAVRARP